MKNAAEFGPRQPLAQPTFLLAVADNEEAKIAMAALLQFLLHACEQGYVFFRRHAAYKTEHVRAIFRRTAALGGMEQ